MQIITKAVPSNLITGFLGAGKTTLIQHLLANKPPAQRWAVLSNEFGEIGLDGDFMSASKTNSEVFIKEVPGGCLCCAAGLPFQVALTRLLREAKPDRLLIEPTGLGHPRQIMQRLHKLSAQANLQLAATLTLVDARVLADSRYRKHPNFAAQLAIADLILASKAECYQAQDFEQLKDYLSQQGLSATPLLSITQGKLAPSYLDSLTRAQSAALNLVSEHLKPSPSTAESSRQTTPEKASCKVHQAEGYTSVGWQLPAHYRFEPQRLAAFIEQLAPLRAKALCQCEQGSLMLNHLAQHTRIELLPANSTNKLELISQELPDISQLNRRFLACCLNADQDLLAELNNKL